MAEDPKVLKIFQLEAILKQKDTLITNLTNELEAIKKASPVDSVQPLTPVDEDFPDMQRYKVTSVDANGKPVIDRVDPTKIKPKAKHVPPSWTCPDCKESCLSMHKRHHKCKVVDNG